MGYRPQSEDTPIEIDRRMMDAYRRMTPVEKASRLSQLCLATQQLAVAGIRERHPGLDGDELRLRLGALRLDADTMSRVFGWDPRSRGY